MVYLTGDTHGDIDRFKHGKLRWLGKRDTVVVLGDFGFVWDGSKEEQKKLDWLRKRPYTLLFLDGSHENYLSEKTSKFIARSRVLYCSSVMKFLGVRLFGSCLIFRMGFSFIKSSS